MRARVDEVDRVPKLLVREDGQDGSEDLLPHEGGIAGGVEDDDWSEFPGRWCTLIVVAQHAGTRRARFGERGSEPCVMVTIDNCRIIRVCGDFGIVPAGFGEYPFPHLDRPGRGHK